MDTHEILKITQEFFSSTDDIWAQAFPYVVPLSRRALKEGYREWLVSEMGEGITTIHYHDPPSFDDARWCLKTPGRLIANHLRFKNEVDAMLFKLTWG